MSNQVNAEKNSLAEVSNPLPAPEQGLGLTTFRTCECARCQEGRFIKRCQSLLPEAEANELGDWYCAFLDNTTEEGMSFYWIDQKLRELTEMVEDFAKRRTFLCDRCGERVERRRREEIDICDKCKATLNEPERDAESVQAGT